MGANHERASRVLDLALRQSYREEGGKMMVQTYQDVEPHLEYAAKCRRVDAEGRGRFGRRGEFRRTMVLPFNVITEIAQRLGIPQGQIFDKENWKRIEREYKSSDYKKLRVVTDKRL